jgi:hypothetical protein
MMQGDDKEQIKEDYKTHENEKNPTKNEAKQEHYLPP